jgi:sulfide:quinone oxidoreductase
MPYDLFCGVPKHRAPDVVEESGMAENGWIPVNPANLETRFPGVYAIGDVASIGIPKAGVFAEGAARSVAKSLLARFRGDDPPPPFAGAAACYIEFGGGRIGRVEVDFLSGKTVTASYTDASTALVAEKHHFGASRRARWFEQTVL